MTEELIVRFNRKTEKGLLLSEEFGVEVENILKDSEECTICGCLPSFVIKGEEEGGVCYECLYDAKFVEEIRKKRWFEI